MLEMLDTLNGYLSTDAVVAVAQAILDENSADTDEERLLALLIHTKCVPGFVAAQGDYYGIPLFAIGDREYAVATEEEADAAHEEYLESYLDEPGLVEGAQGPYFDREAWLRDARIDGRSHSLSSYDGNEWEVGKFLIYRIN